MTEQRYSNGKLAKWYYNLNGDITDGKTIFETHTMHKKDIDELFYDEIHKGSNSLLDFLNELTDENKQLKHNNKMLSMKMSEVYTKYRLLNEFSEDTNPNDAVKRVLSELMQITKEYG